jgi:NADH-ubiquinone oxidoreductase chain 3
MISITFFLVIIPLLTFILLAVNLIFAPHSPYQEKNSPFECGFHSFTHQNRIQFNISFFIFALLFLLFDLEILLAYPYVVSAYSNDFYGLIIMLVFFLALTLGFVFELGKNALKIDSRQNNNTINLQLSLTSLNSSMSFVEVFIELGIFNKLINIFQNSVYYRLINKLANNLGVSVHHYMFVRLYSIIKDNVYILISSYIFILLLIVGIIYGFSLYINIYHLLIISSILFCILFIINIKFIDVKYKEKNPLLYNFLYTLFIIIMVIFFIWMYYYGVNIKKLVKYFILKMDNNSNNESKDKNTSEGPNSNNDSGDNNNHNGRDNYDPQNGKPTKNEELQEDKPMDDEPMEDEPMEDYGSDSYSESEEEDPSITGVLGDLYKELNDIKSQRDELVDKINNSGANSSDSDKNKLYNHLNLLNTCIMSTTEEIDNLTKVFNEDEGYNE